jgi:archaellum component FlaG (FlaF/FlaG flagellin family)
MFTELRWRDNIYVILQVVIFYTKWFTLANFGDVTALSRNMEVQIRVAGSIQRHKTVPFSTTVDVTIKY